MAVKSAQQGSSYRKDFAPLEANSFLYDLTPFRKGFVFGESKQEVTKVVPFCKTG